MPPADRPAPPRPGGLLPWGFARVRGDSMRPGLQAGDRLLVSYRRRPAPGDVVVARFADGTLAVKRAVERRTTATGEPGWWLLSDDPEQGVDSRHRGPVPEQAVVAVVVGRIWPLHRSRPRR